MAMAQSRRKNRQEVLIKGIRVDQERKEDRHGEDVIIDMVKSIWISEEPTYYYEGGQE
jgi:hypothetical protein